MPILKIASSEIEEKYAIPRFSAELGRVISLTICRSEFLARIKYRDGEIVVRSRITALTFKRVKSFNKTVRVGRVVAEVRVFLRRVEIGSRGKFRKSTVLRPISFEIVFVLVTSRRPSFTLA